MLSKDDTGEVKRVKNPVTDEYENITIKPDTGFDHNPATQKWKPDLAKYPSKLVEKYKKAA